MKGIYHHHRAFSRLFTLIVVPFLFLSLSCSKDTAFAGTPRIIFLHHSCGHNLIEQGSVREGLSALGYEFYDHGYNGEGLRLADGSYAGYSFNVPGDNTDPDGLATIFAQPLNDPPNNTFSHLMEYDVILFKSCFPTSNIESDAKLAGYKSHYRQIMNRMAKYPDKIFIIVTQPPEVPRNSDADASSRARSFVNWLKSDEYLAGHDNVFVFDFFDKLSGGDNFLRPGYRTDEYDAHPNMRANETIGPLFVSFIDRVIRENYTGALGRPAAGREEEPPAPEIEVDYSPSPATTHIETSGMIDDFKSLKGYWEYYTEGAGSKVEYGIDTKNAIDGASSLFIRYNIVADGYIDCGPYFESPQDWGGGVGLSLWARCSDAKEWVTLTVSAGDPNNPTPFVVNFEAKREWTLYSFSWTDFRRAEWAEGGLSKIDPSRIIGFGFGIVAGGSVKEGTLWADDLSIIETSD